MVLLHVGLGNVFHSSYHAENKMLGWQSDPRTSWATFHYHATNEMFGWQLEGQLRGYLGIWELANVLEGWWG